MWRIDQGSLDRFESDGVPVQTCPSMNCLELQFISQSLVASLRSMCSLRQVVQVDPSVQVPQFARQANRPQNEGLTAAS